MSAFGISHYGMVFEGDSEYGAHLIWPQPVMTLAKFAKETDEVLRPATNGEIGHCYFREDFFDPVSRIRRGRFYQASGSTNSWQVLPSPNAFMPGRSQTNGMVDMSIVKYHIYKLTNNNEALQNLVVLGSAEAWSVW